MKKLILAVLMPVTLFMTGPGSIALAGEMTPSSIALDLMEVSSLDQAAPKQNLKADVPTVDDGNNRPGVDIVNESLNYHSKVNPQPVVQSLVPDKPAQSGMLNGQIRQNTYGQRNYNQTQMMMNGYQPNMSVNTSAASPMQYPTQMPMMAQPMMMPNPYQAYAMQQKMNDDNMKKAIGVVGAAALMGVFIKNGGLGGVTRSMGWDNKRHIRGASIGGY